MAATGVQSVELLGFRFQGFGFSGPNGKADLKVEGQATEGGCSDCGPLLLHTRHPADTVTLEFVFKPQSKTTVFACAQKTNDCACDQNRSQRPTIVLVFHTAVKDQRLCLCSNRSERPTIALVLQTQSNTKICAVQDGASILFSKYIALLWSTAPGVHMAH